jgi:DNA-binding NarL/FixJ family response regulator
MARAAARSRLGRMTTRSTSTDIPARPERPAAAADARAVRVVVADDHPIVRRALVRDLHEHGGFRVIAETGDGATALALIEELEPDVCVLDVRMPVLDGLDVLERLRGAGRTVPVVLLSAFTDRPLVERARRAGAADYLGKDVDRDRIREALRRAAGRPTAPPERSAPASPPEAGGPLPTLERRVLAFKRAGWDDVTIALCGGIPPHRIASLLDAACRRLGVTTVAQAIAVAEAQDLI